MIPIAQSDLGDAEREAVFEVMESGVIADGPTVREFEADFADFCGVDHAVATANGTTALHAGLVAAGIGPGDAVVTTPFSFVASANAIRFAGAEPVFADIDPDTFTLDPGAVASVARERDLDAVLVVHLYGLPADMDPLLEVAREHDLLLVEDAAQAHGAEYGGERTGSIGDVGCFSFYPTKNMTTGEGGMVTTDDPDVEARARRFIDHGRAAGYEHADLGHNFRMTGIEAAIGRTQLDRLQAFNEARRKNAAALTDALPHSVTTPVEPEGRRHVYHQYTISVSDRDGLRTHLSESGIESRVYYPTPIHRQPAYDTWDCQTPNADDAAEHVLSLPVHPGVDEDDTERIARAVSAYANTNT